MTKYSSREMWYWWLNLTICLHMKYFRITIKLKNAVNAAKEIWKIIL